MVSNLKNDSLKKLEKTEKKKNPKEKGGEEGHIFSQFIIEFTPMRSMMSIKYLCQKEINMDNIDFLMFQFNNFVACWESASVE